MNIIIALNIFSGDIEIYLHCLESNRLMVVYFVCCVVSIKPLSFQNIYDLQNVDHHLTFSSPIFIALDLQGDTESEYSLIYHNESFRKWPKSLLIIYFADSSSK